MTYFCLPITGARAYIPVLSLWLLALSPLPAFAVIVDSLFEVEIPVLDESRQVRQAALADGLVEILVRVSGDRNILQKISPPSANAYLKQFRYIAVDPVAENGARKTEDDQPSHILWAQYNATRVMDLLRKNSIPIWGEHRSQAVIWLAVRDGTNQYILREQDSSLLKDKANESFQRRGIPVVWPRNDARDQQSLKFADVWAGFAEPLKAASGRYTAGPVISVSMVWNGSAWVGDWSVFMGRDSRRWTFKDPDYSVLISQAIELVADTMGEEFAVLEAVDTEAHNQVMVQIDQVGSVKQFKYVQQYLNSLPVVQSVNLTQIEPERVAFKLTLRSEVDDFLDLVKTDTRMLPMVTADIDGATGGGITNNIYRFKLLN